MVLVLRLTALLLVLRLAALLLVQRLDQAEEDQMVVHMVIALLVDVPTMISVH